MRKLSIANRLHYLQRLGEKTVGLRKVSLGRVSEGT